MSNVDSRLLDDVCVSLCSDFLSDISAGDPRWQKHTQPGLGSSYSMQIMQQISDKEKCHNLFLQFLKDNHLWEKLSTIRIRDKSTATVWILGEYSEKIVAAMSLKSLPTNEVIDNAIENVVKVYEGQFDDNLTSQDIFYKDIPKIYTVFQEMVSICNTAVHSDLSVQEAAILIKNTNDVILVSNCAFF